MEDESPVGQCSPMGNSLSQASFNSHSLTTSDEASNHCPKQMLLIAYQASWHVSQCIQRPCQLKILAFLNYMALNPSSSGCCVNGSITLKW